MRFQLPLLCLCAVTVLAGDHHDAVVKTDDAHPAAKDAPVADSGKAADSVVAVKQEVEAAVLKEVSPSKEEVDDAQKGATSAKNVGEVTPLLEGNKTWGEAVNNLAPSAEVFSAHLALYSKANVKPNIAMAYDLHQEQEHWIKNGNPERLEFIGDDGKPTYGIVSHNQPVLQTNYADGVRFHFFHKYNESDIQGEQVKVKDFGKLVDLGWDAKLPVKIIVHGFTNTIQSPAIQLLKNAFLKTGKYNVVGVDWGDLCKAPWYDTARSHVSGAGAKVGEFVDALVKLKLTEPALVHIIGHSLGAHVAGIAGKSMTTGKAKRITGLDPAGPLFQLTKPDGHIWRDDAELVDIIHTNAGYLGKTKALGHVDFFPNGGHFQPGCPFDVTGSCSHARSYEYFAFTVRENRPIRGAHICPSLPSGANDCAGMKSSFAAMGYPLKYTTGGSYYVKTLPSEPFEDIPSPLFVDTDSA